uniref:BTB domain-containing protein n=1 Tax=Setaria italica TaxID=4555 RepID=K4AJI0_SETIT
MPSAPGRRKPSRSSSAIVADKERGRHELRIDAGTLDAAAPAGERGLLASSPFTVGGHRWRVRYYPNGTDAESKGWVSIFLFLDEDVAEPVDRFSIRCDIVVLNGFRTKEEAPSAAIPPSDLQKHLGDLLQSGRGTDVVFEVGGEAFAAHRCVLAARSPVISADLLGAASDGAAAAGVVRVDGVETRALKALLRYAYTDSLPEMDREEEDAILRNVAADRYSLQRLKLICEDRLCRLVSVGTVEITLALAEQHNCDRLKEACLQFLGAPANLRAAMGARGQ